MAMGLRSVKIKFTGDASDLKRAAAAAADSVKKVNKTLQSAVGGIGGKVIDAIGAAVDAIPPMGKPIALALGGGLAVFLSPIIGAAVSSALLMALGGGVLYAGIKSAADSPKVKQAFAGLKKTASSVFEDFGKPFEKPLARLLKSFDGTVEKMRGPLERMGKVIAPVLDRIGPAVREFGEKALPGIEKAVTASVPLFTTLAEKLPMIGESIGTFFEEISSNSDDTTQFFADLLDVIGSIIVALGKVISFLASFYGEMRTQIIAMQVTWQKFKIYLIDNVFGPILDAAEASLSWIPGLSGKLASAREKFAEFRRDANAELAMIQSKWTVTIIANFQARGFKSPSPGEFTGRAAGGPVRAGGTYLVGENGPEVLTMAGNGWVHNNRQMQQSSGGDTYELHVDLGAGVRQVIAFSNRDLKRRTRARSAGYA